MIEITAKLSRGPVYFTSEEVICYATFKNVLAKDVLPRSEQDHVSLNCTKSSRNSALEQTNGSPGSRMLHKRIALPNMLQVIPN